MFWKNTLSLSKEDDNRYKVEVYLDDRLKQTDAKFPITIDMSWEMHREKQPDSVIYSGLPDTNQYLTDISIIGANEINGIGRNYSRLRIHEYIQDDPKNIKSAFYAAYEMTGLNSPTEIAVHKITDFWSSTGLTQNTKVKEGTLLTSNIVQKRGYQLFDITQVARASLNDDTYNMEVFGMMLKESDEKEHYRIFASSDHCLFPVFEEITFYNMPQDFNAYRKK